MRSRLVTICAVGALAFTGVACGGDDDNGGGGGGSSLQDQVADELMDEVGDDDTGVDEDCIRRTTGELTDADARALLDNDEASFSAEGGVVLSDLFECIDLGDIDLDDLDDLDDVDTDG